MASYFQVQAFNHRMVKKDNDYVQSSLKRLTFKGLAMTFIERTAQIDPFDRPFLAAIAI